MSEDPKEDIQELDSLRSKISEAAMETDQAKETSSDTEEALEDGKIPCALCDTVVTEGEEKLAHGNPVCEPCYDEILEEIAKEKPQPIHLLLGSVGGLAGALISAGVWAGIAIGTGYEIGYVAIGVGFLTGMGVGLLSSGKKGFALQVISAGMSVLGLVVAKYFMFAHYFKIAVKEKHGMDIGYFNSAGIEYFFTALADMLGGFDLLWVFLALITAWGMLAPTDIHATKDEGE